MRTIHTAALMTGTLGLGTLSLALAPAASAARPEMEVDSYLRTSTYAAGEVCPMELQATDEITDRIQTFEDGTVRLVRNGTTTVVASSNPDTDTPVVDHWVLTRTWDPESASIVTTGNEWNTHLPGTGTGVLVNESGRLVVDYDDGDPADGFVVFSAGPHETDEVGPGSFGDCSALLD